MSLIESYQSNRIADRLQAAAQFLLVLLILAAINTIAMRSYTRFDTTLNRSFTLSAQTVAYLTKLQQPINIVVTLSEQSRDVGMRDTYQAVKALLSEYAYETRHQGEDRVRVEYLNIFQQARRAK
ncbi:MAG: GldG family protein [Opitutales bacterium]|nr:GldG family protein [Opitutales bacterium]